MSDTFLRSINIRSAGHNVNLNFALAFEDFSNGRSNELRDVKGPADPTPTDYTYHGGKEDDLSILLVMHAGVGTIVQPYDIVKIVEQLHRLAIYPSVESEGGPASYRTTITIGNFFRRTGYVRSIKETWSGPFGVVGNSAADAVIPHHCEVTLTLAPVFPGALTTSNYRYV